MYRDVLGFSITPKMQRLMTINGCHASIMRTEKKKENSSMGLPSGVPIPILPVDYLKERPENWIGGEGSYVCPVDSEWGLWFNWSMNNPLETAVLPSVKGMNPLTGQRMGNFNLEYYSEECPIHKEAFSTGKYCVKCGFKWPHQGFLSAPDKLFLDGFRMPDGNVRQFYFTEEMAKSIPEQVIGKEDTVPAFGFCFYHLKERRKNYEGGTSFRDEFPNLKQLSNTSKYLYDSHTYLGGTRYPETFTSSVDYECRERSVSFYTTNSTEDVINEAVHKTGLISPLRNFRKKRYRSANPKKIKTAFSSSSTFKDRSNMEVGLGAGAKIKQNFRRSQYELSDWAEKPTGIIRLYFVFQEEFERYAAVGLHDLEGSKEGYLKGLSIGGGS